MSLEMLTISVWVMIRRQRCAMMTPVQTGHLGQSGQTALRHVEVAPRGGAETVLLSGMEAPEMIVMERMRRSRSATLMVVQSSHLGQSGVNVPRVVEEA